MVANAPMLFALAAVATTTGCASGALPDPRATVAEYRAALERGDAAAVHRLLTEEASVAYGVGGTRRLIGDARPELIAEARAVSVPSATVEAVAELPFADGERAVLRADSGRYRVSGASGLPSAARTPAQALTDLRVALSRRSYPALVRILSAETRAALEQDLRTLVEGLQAAGSLDVKVSGSVAEVAVPGGHRVVLKREAGVWRVHDLD